MRLNYILSGALFVSLAVNFFLGGAWMSTFAHRPDGPFGPPGAMPPPPPLIEGLEQRELNWLNLYIRDKLSSWTGEGKDEVMSSWNKRIEGMHENLKDGLRLRREIAATLAEETVDEQKLLSLLAQLKTTMDVLSDDTTKSFLLIARLVPADKRKSIFAPIAEGDMPMPPPPPPPPWMR